MNLIHLMQCEYKFVITWRPLPTILYVIALYESKVKILSQLFLLLNIHIYLSKSHILNPLCNLNVRRVTLYYNFGVRQPTAHGIMLELFIINTKKKKIAVNDMG